MHVNNSDECDKNMRWDIGCGLCFVQGSVTYDECWVRLGSCVETRSKPWARCYFLQIFLRDFYDADGHFRLSPVWSVFVYINVVVLKSTCKETSTWMSEHKVSSNVIRQCFFFLHVLFKKSTKPNFQELQPFHTWYSIIFRHNLLRCALKRARSLFCLCMKWRDACLLFWQYSVRPGRPHSSTLKVNTTNGKTNSYV